jgi:hypothetical protein
MRKKSHISLAKHIVGISEIPEFFKHRTAFYIGSILPDCKPSFLTRRHEITATFGLVEQGIARLTQHIEDKKLSTGYFARLGEVTHYIADYFTFPHNKEYMGGFKQHCIYEGQLKFKLHSYIRHINEQELVNWKRNLKLGDMERFHSVADICEFLKEEHRNYIRRGIHSVDEDCKYIVGICSKVVAAIAHVREIEPEFNAVELAA